MSDVARRAGVSLSTVSYALSGIRPVSEPTKQRIRAAMDELDFAPNAVAQGLAGRRTKILAFVIPTDETPVDPYTGEIIVGAAEAAREAGYHLLLWTEPASRSSEIKNLVATGLIDGAIVMAIQLDDPRITMLETTGVPLAMIGRTENPYDLTYVDADADDVGRQAIEHLFERGRRSIAHVAAAAADPAAGYGIAVRLHAGLHRWARSFGVELVSDFAGRTAADATSNMARLLDANPAIDGVVAFGDVMLGGSLGGLVASGRSVPDDVAVVGLLCTDFTAEVVHPRATTISPPVTDLGRAAAEAIMRRLGDGTVGQRLIEPVLVRRDSS